MNLAYLGKGVVTGRMYKVCEGIEMSGGRKQIKQKDSSRYILNLF